MPIKPPSDAAVRQAALDPSQSFLIQAPAGSGKTELLTDRILALLATVNRPEEIVAITFTRKAASEMHARVMSKLLAGRGPEPLEEHKVQSWRLARTALARDGEMGWSLLEYPARLSIRTIDSFCAWLVRSMPWLTALGGLPAITDDASVHYQEAAKATLAMADDVDSVAQLLEHLDVDTRQACELIARMLGGRDQWLPILGDSSDAGQLLVNLQTAVEADLARLASLMPPGWGPSLAPPLSTAARTLLERGDPCDFRLLADWKGEPFGTSFGDLAKWQALACALLTKSGNTLRLKVNKSQGFDPKTPHKDDFTKWLGAWEGTEPWVAALADARSAPPGGYQPEQLAVLSNLVQALWLASAQLSVSFSEAGEVDFIEIAQRALQALGQADDPSDLLLALDASIRHLLVDEFQDTSQSQIELLSRLTSGWQTGDGRTLFLVGDPMQSIYRFRKAEVGLFLKVQQDGLGELSLTALQLTDNFRSQANVVEWVNTVFRPLFPSLPDPALGAIPYTPSAAYNPGDPEGIGVELHPVWCPPQLDDAAACRSSESIAVHLVKQALSRHAGSAHPVAILVRARSHLKNVVRRLSNEGIPCRAVELVSLRSRQIVDDIVQLARALSHAGDRLAWLSVLRSPVCGLKLTTLHALFGDNHEETVPTLLSSWVGGRHGVDASLEHGEVARLKHAATVLLDAGNASGTIPFAAWVQQCWNRLGGPAVYPHATDYADAESLFRLIEKLAPYGALDPDALDAKLEQLYAAPEATGHAVEVMTIHKSKGLQFDTVILMGLHQGAAPDRAPLIRLEQAEGRLLLGPIKPRASETQDAVSNYLAAREKKRASYETDRLLYVAATRAREQLHLIAHISLDDAGDVKDPPDASLLRRLWPHIRQPVPPGAGELAGEEQALSSGPSTHRLRRVHHSALSQAGSITLPGASQADWQWTQERSEEAVMGTVAHAWLERIGKDGPQQWTPAHLDSHRVVLRKQLSRAGLGGAALEQAEAAVFDTLCATLSSERGQWLMHVAGAYREWSLLDVSGRVSVIDLAISDEAGWLVVDYKTAVPHAGEDLERFSARMRQRHGSQLARYREHVQALDGRPARGALYFPRADIWIDC